MTKTLLMLIAFGLFTTISPLTAQTTVKKEQQKMSPKEKEEKEKMRILFNMLGGMDDLPNIITYFESLPWETETTDTIAGAIPSHEELSRWVGEIRLKQEYEENNTRMRLTAKIGSGVVGAEGMEDNHIELNPTDAGVKDGGTLSILTESLPTIGNLRVKLTSHLHDAKGESIGFDAYEPFYFIDKYTKDTYGNYNRYFELTFSLNAIYSFVAGGYVEMQLLAPQQYQQIRLSAADTLATDYKVFDSIPFRVRLFRNDKLLISSYAQYADTIKDTWQYICVRNGQPVESTSQATNSGRYEEVIAMYNNPDMTFDEWWEIMTAYGNRETVADTDEWSRLYETGIADMEQFYFYKLLPEDASTQSAPVRASWEDRIPAGVEQEAGIVPSD